MSACRASGSNSWATSASRAEAGRGSLRLPPTPCRVRSAEGLVKASVVRASGLGAARPGQSARVGSRRRTRVGRARGLIVLGVAARQDLANREEGEAIPDVGPSQEPSSPRRIHVLDQPHSASPCARRASALELRRFARDGTHFRPSLRATDACRLRRAPGPTPLGDLQAPGRGPGFRTSPTRARPFRTGQPCARNTRTGRTRPSQTRTRKVRRRGRFPAARDFVTMARVPRARRRSGRGWRAS
jgi:hypothetical protein